MINVKKALSVFLLTSLLAGIFAVFSGDFGSAQTSTSIKGIISEDTTWGSGVYVFEGSVGVPEGVTLNLEAGVWVDMRAFDLQVNGSLIAKGAGNEKVVFTSSTEGNCKIVLVYGNPACSFENVVLGGVSFFGQNAGSNAKLDLMSCILNESDVTVWGTTAISNSYVNGAVQLKGSSQLSNSSFLRGIGVAADSTAVSSFSISGNNITNIDGGAVLSVGGSGVIRDNLVWGGSVGICQADEFETMSADIENNVITGNDVGVFTRTLTDDSVIKGNVIVGNGIGISNPSPKQTITGNDIERNSQYNIQAGVNAVNAANNYWGTTNRGKISEGIYDSYDDFDLGTVVFVPFLSEANDTFGVALKAPTEMAGVEFEVGGQSGFINRLDAAIAIAVIAVVLVAVFVVWIHKRRQ